MNRASLTRIGIVLFITFTIVLAALVMIGRLQTLPRGTHYGTWDLSGYTYEQFAAEWMEWSQKWGEKTVVIESPPPYTDKFSLSRSALGLTPNADSIFQDIETLRYGRLWDKLRLRWNMRNHTYPERIDVDEQTLQQTVQSTWTEIENSQPQNAKRIINANDHVQIQEEKSAYRVDVQELGRQLRTFIPATAQEEGAALTLPLSEIRPERSAEMLQAQKIERKIAEFTTHFRSSTKGRVHNIRSSAQVVHDRVLAPQEIFDYSEIVRLTEQQFGFQPAPVILNGKLVPGIGGGICQVSSTLYNAALLAGLEIVERRHHSLPVQYVPLGLDATFSSGNINFRFRNHGHSHLLIRTETSESHITVKLFGSLPEGISYRIHSQVTRTLDPPLKYVQNQTLAPGTQQVVQKGRTGYVVETERIKIENGQETEREQISRDVYQPQPTLIAVRNHNKPEQKKPNPPILEDGVFGPVFE